MKKIYIEQKDGVCINLTNDNSESVRYPAIKIIKNNTTYIFPTVASYDNLRSIKNIGFFKPKDPTAKLVLAEHNLINYKRSSLMNQLYNPFHDMLHSDELNENQTLSVQIMCEELAEMQDKGIAFQL